MGDFPDSFPNLGYSPFISTADPCCPMGEIFSAVATTAGSAVYDTANRAHYIETLIERTFKVRQMFLWIGTVTSGNVDVGIYDEKGNLIVSKGSTPAGAVSTLQQFDMTTAVTGTPSPVLNPGVYFLACAADNVTLTLERITGGSATVNSIWGSMYQNSAFPLPSTAVFGAGSQPYMPIISMAENPT